MTFLTLSLSLCFKSTGSAHKKQCNFQLKVLSKDDLNFFDGNVPSVDLLRVSTNSHDVQRHIQFLVNNYAVLQVLFCTNSYQCI